MNMNTIGCKFAAMRFLKKRKKKKKLSLKVI